MSLYLTSISDQKFKMIVKPGFILSLDFSSPFRPIIDQLPDGAYKLTDGDYSYIKFNIKEGKIDGEYRHYDKDLCAFAEVGQYKDGERIGVWISQDFGQHYTLDHYIDGYLDGVSLNYTKGRLSSSITYKRGKYHGLYKSYHPTGKVAFKTNYVNHKMHGFGYYYDDKGRLFKKELYKNDRIIWGHNLSPASKNKLIYKM